MEARAIARFVRVSPTKVDRVLRQIRGLQVERAQEVLAYSPRPIAKQIGKVLTSAVANATNREQGAAPDQLYVKTAVADSGPSLKRIQPRAQGRAYAILKRMTHITIIVAERVASYVEEPAVAQPTGHAEPKGEAKPAGRAAKALAAVRKATGTSAPKKKAPAKKPAAKKPASKAAPKRGAGAVQQRKERKK
jgi:large subunit ribosomal protein L22